MADRGEEALTFVEVRRGSPQWEVMLPNGALLARVTERYITTPPYVVCFDRGENVAEDEVECEDQDEVIALLLERMPNEFR